MLVLFILQVAKKDGTLLFNQVKNPSPIFFLNFKFLYIINSKVVYKHSHLLFHLKNCLQDSIFDKNHWNTYSIETNITSCEN